jgi:hypothetical protein
VAGGILGIFTATVLIRLLTQSSLALGIPTDMNVKLPTVVLALLVAATVGFISGYIPA